MKYLQSRRKCGYIGSTVSAGGELESWRVGSLWFAAGSVGWAVPTGLHRRVRVGIVTSLNLPNLQLSRGSRRALFPVAFPGGGCLTRQLLWHRPCHV